MESNLLTQMYNKVKLKYVDLKLLTNQTLIKNKALFLKAEMFTLTFRNEKFLEENPDIKNDLILISEDLESITAFSKTNLHTLATSFIQRLLSSLKINEIQFTEKRAGVQSGLVANVLYSNNIINEPFVSKFYIKTHQEGGITASSASSKPVVFQELFVYKALENLGLGPKIDFFFDEKDPVKEFYISSLEAGSKLLEPTDEVKPVIFPFKLAKEYGVNEVLNQEIGDKYRNLDEQLFKCMKKELTLIDIISRIFFLNDCSTNSSNFGFIIKSNIELSAMIIDFRVDFRFDINSNIFEQFCSGNLQFNYCNNSLFRHVMLLEISEVKLARAVEVTERLKYDLFSEIVDKSEQEIVKFICNCGNVQLTKYFNDEILTLKRYITCVKKNFEIFCAQLHKNAII